MQQVVIGAYRRTAFSRARPRDPEQDPFNSLTAEELLAQTVAVVMKDVGVGPDDADNFIVGCALGVGEQWTFGGRTSSLLAGLGAGVPARSLDMQCGSGMAAIESGFFEIACGQAEIIIVGGMEHMTRMPIGPKLFEKGYVKVNPAVYRKSSDWDMVTGLNMGLTAELLAEQQGFDRRQLDEFAVRSHRLAAAAAKQNFFREETIPVRIPGSDSPLTLDDQNIRAETCVEELAALKTPFQDNGVISAGNSSPLSTGAASLVLMSEDTADRKGIQPIAKILATGIAGVRPELMGTGPIPAIEKALHHAKMSPADIDVWEINEAFSVVVLNAVRGLGLDLNRVNVHGGALAIGHPLGATGVRLVGTLARILREKGQKLGCAAACIGGGQGIAIIIEAC